MSDKARPSRDFCTLVQLPRISRQFKFAERELRQQRNVQNLHTFRLEVRRTSRVKSARRQAYTRVRMRRARAN